MEKSKEWRVKNGETAMRRGVRCWKATGPLGEVNAILQKCAHR